MANIAQAKVKEQWTKINDLISGFTPTADSKYLIQNKEYQSLQIYEGATAPTDERVGFIIKTHEAFEWTAKSNEYLFLKAYSNQATFNISEA